MPQVGRKKFGYNPSGMLAARRESRRTGRPVNNQNYGNRGLRPGMPSARPSRQGLMNPRPMVAGPRRSRPMRPTSMRPMGPRPLRRRGSGGSRRMGTPSPSRIMGGRNRRGY